MPCVSGFSISSFLEILLIVPTVILSVKLLNTNEVPFFEVYIGVNTSASPNNGIFFGLVTGNIMSSVHRRKFQFTNWLQFLHLYDFGYSYIIEGNPNISYNHSGIVEQYMIKTDKNSERAA